MSVEKDIRYELLARLCPNSTGIEYFVNEFAVFNVIVAVAHFSSVTIHYTLTAQVGK